MESLASKTMLNNYMMSHKTELENDQKGVAAMQSVFEALQLTITNEELKAEVAQAEQEFKVSPYTLPSTQSSNPYPCV